MTKALQIATPLNHTPKCFVIYVIPTSMTRWTTNINRYSRNRRHWQYSFVIMSNMNHEVPQSISRAHFGTWRKVHRKVSYGESSVMSVSTVHHEKDRGSGCILSPSCKTTLLSWEWQMSDIYAIVLTTHLLLNWYSCLLLLLTIATRDTWLYCHTSFTWNSGRFGGWLRCGDGWWGWG